MGSDSDKKILDPGAALLRKWGIPYESNITSAHRTPERMIQYARQASERGVQCIIAAAGGAVRDKCQNVSPSREALHWLPYSFKRDMLTFMAGSPLRDARGMYKCGSHWVRLSLPECDASL